MIGIVSLLICVLVYVRFGEVPSQIYTETKFEEVRWGPHQTVIEIDEALSWLRRSEISRDSIHPSLLRGRDIEPLMKGIDVHFISYYIGAFGFIVVYDLDGNKLTQLKSDI